MLRSTGMALAALLAVLAPGRSAAATRVDNPHTSIEIIAESMAPAAGQPVTIGLALTPRPGWHTYWLNPGDAGAATRVAWALPPGTPEPQPLRYPVPETLIVSGLMNYVYAHPNVLLTTLTPPAELSKGTPLAVTVKVDWLVCSLELCVPEGATLTLPLVIGNGALDPNAGYRIALAEAAIPKPVNWAARWAVDKGRFAMSVPFGATQDVRKAYFFPLNDGTIDYAAPQTVTMRKDALRIETKAGTDPKGPVSGVLRIESADRADAEPQVLGFAITAQPGPVAAAGLPLASARPVGETQALLPVLLAAVLGGIILNIMPCVFPILSLKALSLAKGNVEPAAARRDAVAYTLGVVVICAALGSAVLLLRAAGTQVGWAFQLQDPRVIAGLLLLVTAIALNLAGVFEVTVSASGGDELTRRGGFMGSFWTGALAAFVATPCTGPFMAGALGAALVLPPAASIAVFAGLGFGLALPFLLIGFIPALRRRLPQPGPWMVRLRAILSVPMFLTALALAWVLGRQAGVSGMTAGLAGALVLGLALWWLGSRQAGQQARWLPLGAAIAVVVVAIVLLPVSEPAAATGISGPAGLAAERFTMQRLADLRQRKTPVFVYLTADWCLTCKVNERGAMADAGVAAAFARRGVVTLEGDWTRGDPLISTFLAEQGRAGVPLYLFYGADGRIEELPQILTIAKLTSLAA